MGVYLHLPMSKIIQVRYGERVKASLNDSSERDREKRREIARKKL